MHVSPMYVYCLSIGRVVRRHDLSFACQDECMCAKEPFLSLSLAFFSLGIFSYLVMLLIDHDDHH